MWTANLKYKLMVWRNSFGYLSKEGPIEYKEVFVNTKENGNIVVYDAAMDRITPLFNLKHPHIIFKENFIIVSGIQDYADETGTNTRGIEMVLHLFPILTEK